MNTRSIIYFLLLILLFSLSACQTTNPYTGEQQTAKAASGAMIGSVVGAILGAATADKEDRKERLLKGAGIGAIAGGGIGYYMDVQEAKLREELQGTGVSVSRDGDQLTLNMPGNITFETDSHGLRPEFFEVLDSVALVLNEFKSSLITVTGHTDSTGSDEHNLILSRHRATTVAMYLENSGVLPERIAAAGYGEKFPTASNDTAEGRAQNRRVELQIDPISE